MRKTAGWIKLHRKLKDDTLWTNEPFTKGQAWVDLIMMAQFRNKKLLIGNKMETVPRGSFVTSEVKLSERWKWSRGKVRGFLTMLVNEGMIDKNKTGNYTALTIINYGFYQDEKPEKRQPIEQPVDTLLNNELTAERQPIDSQLNTKEERKKEKKVKEGEEGKERKKGIEYQLIADMYNDTCVSLPRCTKLSDSRKKAISARMKSGYAFEDFKKLFERAEESRFLKGGNDRNWKANFDWLIKDSNMAKVLDGNYSNKEPPRKNSSQTDWDAVRKYYGAEEVGYDNTGDN